MASYENFQIWLKRWSETLAEANRAYAEDPTIQRAKHVQWVKECINFTNNMIEDTVCVDSTSE